MSIFFFCICRSVIKIGCGDRYRSFLPWMKVSALLTSVGINIALCVVLLSLYSILRKQPGNFSVYFGRKLARERKRQKEGHFSFERFVPSPSWIVKAWGYTEDEILAIAGLDAVVFLRILIFRWV